VKRLLILVALVLILLCSCVPRLTEGTIIDKKYKPQAVWVSYIYVNKSLIPQTHVSPESYTIRIEGIVDGQKVTNEKKVPSYIYEKVSVGDWWTDDMMN